MLSAKDSDNASPPNQQASWQYVAWVMCSVLVLLAAIAAFNAWVDSTGTLGTGLIDPIAELPRDRKAKVEVIEQAKSPDLVVLGSSRSKRIDPLMLSNSDSSVNAAVVGSDIFEQLVFTSWLDKRADQGHPFPQLVIGIDAEQWRDRSLNETGLLAVPQLAPIARKEARGTSSLTKLLPEIDDLVLSWSATRTSIESLRTRGSSQKEAQDASTDTDRVTLTRKSSDFDKHGIPLDDKSLLTSQGKAKLKQELPEELDSTITEYQGRYGTIKEDAIDDFSELLNTANDNNAVPVIVLTPMHPKMAQALAPEGRIKRLSAVRKLLQHFTKQGKMQLIDCTNCLSARADNWIDGVHPSPLGAKRLTKAIASRIANPLTK